jgi:hypothetical protein
MNVNFLRKWLVGRGIKRTELAAPRTAQGDSRYWVTQLRVPPLLVVLRKSATSADQVPWATPPTAPSMSSTISCSPMG